MHLMEFSDIGIDSTGLSPMSTTRAGTAKTPPHAPVKPRTKSTPSPYRHSMNNAFFHTALKNIDFI
jgi:hypothetical protein